MFYTRERDLQERLETIDWEFLETNQHVYSKREVPVGECIPDLVFVCFSTIPKGINFPKKIGSKHAYITWLFRKNIALSIEEIAEKSFQKPERIIRYVKDLSESGILVKSENCKFRLNDQLFSIQSEIVAIEAKLTRWKEAFQQAKRYQEFADTVVVAMDAEATPRELEILLLFEQEKIGLLAVKPDNAEWVVKPDKEFSASFEREYVLSRALTDTDQTHWFRR